MVFTAWMWLWIPALIVGWCWFSLDGRMAQRRGEERRHRFRWYFWVLYGILVVASFAFVWVFASLATETNAPTS